MVETLLASGASAHIRNAKGWAAVHSAAAAGQLEVVLRLVAAGAAPRSRPDLDVLRLLTRKTTYRCPPLVCIHSPIHALPLLLPTGSICSSRAAPAVTRAQRVALSRCIERWSDDHCTQ